jgi:LysM repeat protein
MSGNRPIGPGFAPIPRPRQTFHEIPPDRAIGMFFPWKHPAPSPTRTRDAASRPSTIGEHVASQYTFDSVVRAALAIGQRISALEARKQAMQQQQPIAPQPMPRSAPTQDHAKTCSCQQPVPPPKATFEDKAMRAHLGLAPRNNLTFNATSRSTHDQNRYGETPSRFDSAEADRMARHIVGAGPPSAREMNDANRAYWARDAKQQYNTSGGHGAEAIASDPSERFIGNGPFDQFGGDVTRPSPAALSEMNARYSKARTPQARDAIEDAWKDYMSGARNAHDASQFKPRQPAVSAQAPKKDNTDDANWSNLYSKNADVIGSDPNKISPGMQLNVGGGQTHTVQSGETISGIASQYSGGGSTPTPTPRPANIGEGYSQGAEPGQAASRNEEKMLGSPTESTSAAPTPTPPVRPSGLGGQAEASTLESSQRATANAEAMNESPKPAPEGTPMPPSRPYSLGGGSQGPSGGDIGNATNPNEAAGESFLKSQGIGTSDARKPRGGGGRK